MPVRASGEKLRPLLEGQPHLVVPVEVVGGERHEPELGPPRRRGSSLPSRFDGGDRQPGRRRTGSASRVQAVGHRVPAVVGVGEHDRWRCVAAVEHERAVGDARASSAQRAGEAAAWFDESDERPGRQVEALQRPAPQEAHLPRRASARRCGGGRRRRPARRRDRPRYAAPTSRAGLVEPQLEDGVVELAARRQRPQPPPSTAESRSGTDARSRQEAAAPRSSIDLDARTPSRRLDAAVERRRPGTVGGPVRLEPPGPSPARARRSANAAARHGGVDQAPRRAPAAPSRPRPASRTRRRGRAGRRACRRRGSARRCRAARPSSGTSGSDTADVAVVDQHDLVARQRQLVAAARGRAVDRGEPHLARVRATRPRWRCRVSLVNLQKFTLWRCVGVASIWMLAPAREDLVEAAGEHDGADLGVLEAQPLRRRRPARCRRRGRRS